MIKAEEQCICLSDTIDSKVIARSYHTLSALNINNDYLAQDSLNNSDNYS